MIREYWHSLSMLGTGCVEARVVSMSGSSGVGMIVVGTVVSLRVSVVVTVTFCLGLLLCFFLSVVGGNGGRGISEELSEEEAGEKMISSSSSIASSLEGVWEVLVSLSASSASSVSSSLSRRASSAFSLSSRRASSVRFGLVVRLAFELVAVPSISMG